MSGVAGATSSPATGEVLTIDATSASPSRTSRIPGSPCFSLMPSPCEAFAWESMSTSSTFSPDCARFAARLTAVVVLPTPPFWFAIA